jgi:hypothetical protein
MRQPGLQGIEVSVLALPVLYKSQGRYDLGLVGRRESNPHLSLSGGSAVELRPWWIRKGGPGGPASDRPESDRSVGPEWHQIARVRPPPLVGDGLAFLLP